jgi:release factor glutamine methyltransferase
MLGMLWQSTSVAEDFTPAAAAGLRSCLDWAVQQLHEARIETPRADAELLLAHALSLSRGQLGVAVALNRPVPADKREEFVRLVSQRASRVPLQHLTGTAPFRHLELRVGPGVFVPRPETETLVDEALAFVDGCETQTPIVFDLCTGSGAVALALATERAATRVYAVERDRYALEWAKLNVEAIASQNVTLVAQDVRKLTDEPALTAELAQVDVVVSNPPYVPLSMVPKDPEVREYDPHAALYSGSDGLDLIRSIIDVSQHFVRPGGLLILEHAENQGAEIQHLLIKGGWENTFTRQDLTGRDRVTGASRPRVGTDCVSR